MTTEVRGFEDELLSLIASGFRFTTEPMKHVPLQVGRHLFLQDMPEVEDLLETAPDFRESEEAVVAVYTDTSPGVTQSLRGQRSDKLDYSLRVFLRFGTVPEKAKELLEQLSRFLLTLRGRSGKYLLKGVFPLNRPTVFARTGDDHAYVSATFRFLVVTLN